MQDAGDGLPGLAKDFPEPEFHVHRLIFHLDGLVLVKFDHFYVFTLDIQRSGKYLVSEGRPVEFHRTAIMISLFAAALLGPWHLQTVLSWGKESGASRACLHALCCDSLTGL